MCPLIWSRGWCGYLFLLSVNRCRFNVILLVRLGNCYVTTQDYDRIVNELDAQWRSTHEREQDVMDGFRSVRSLMERLFDGNPVWRGDSRETVTPPRPQLGAPTEDTTPPKAHDRPSAVASPPTRQPPHSQYQELQQRQPQPQQQQQQHLLIGAGEQPGRSVKV